MRHSGGLPCAAGDRPACRGGLRRRWALAFLLGMPSAGCNEILGNVAHDLDFDATSEDGAPPTDGASHDDGQSSALGGEGGTRDATLYDATPEVGPSRDGGADATTTVQTGDAAVESQATDAAGAPDTTQVVTPPSCLGGGACSPNDCQNGTWVCADAGRVCQETTAVSDGTPCGATTGGDAGAHVCSAGQCAACNAGADCSDPAMPCVRKSYTCTSGTAVCAVTGNVADGTACGTGLYCNGGACAACKVGAACPPAGNACHLGKITACAAGVPTCTDQATPAPAGTSCGAAGGAAGVCDGSQSCI
ncbi:MAG TPA: hypothetical protein VN894_10785, partial [Polyangiaceae bacterium]|nr:hypothetical protein [Polyangiaceae bacterium]